MDINLQKGIFVSKWIKSSFIGLCFAVFVIYGYFIYNNIIILKDENKILRIQTQNLVIFSEDKGRILKLEDILFKETDLTKYVKDDKIPSLAQKILSTAAKYKDDGLTAAQLLAIIEVESVFNPKAISRAKDGSTPVAYGLMQIVRSTATPILKDIGYDWSLNTILIPEINIEVGTKYLVILHRQFISMNLENVNEFHISYIAYNRGERLVLESVDARKKATVSLDYLGKVKMAERTWKSKGF
jgi:membrane-bound lytic murein transglycosylase MltF